MTALEQLQAHVADVERHLAGRVAVVEAEHAALAHQFQTASHAVDERGQQVERRVETLDADQFTLTEQLRLVADDATRAVRGLDDLERELAELQERVTDREADFENGLWRRPQAPDLTGDSAVPADPDPDPGDTDDTAPQPPTADRLHAWVAEHISPLVRKITATGEGGGVRWCRHWWLHHEAVDRFVALYWVFTELSEQNTFGWLSVYLRDHLDPHLAILTSPFGPFHTCSPNRHSDTGSPLGHAEFDAPDDGMVGTAATARALARDPADGSTAGTT